MGEARRRRLTDPSYGKPPQTPHLQSVPRLLQGERGLVVSAPIEVQTIGNVMANGSIVPSRMALFRLLPGEDALNFGQLSLQELRFSLLFWDKLAWPSVEKCDPSDGRNSAEAQLLMQEGLLDRVHYKLPPNGMVTADAIVQGQLSAFRELEAREPGCWAMSLGESSLDVLDQSLVEGRGALLELHKALLVPDKDVALEDLLEFRLRRNAELQQLRTAIDTFYDRVASSGDGAHAMASACAEIDAACRNAIAVALESGRPFRLSSVKVLFEAAAMFATTQPFLAQQNLSATSSSLVAGSMSAAYAVLSIRSGLKELPPRRTPYKYVGQYHDELFGG